MKALDKLLNFIFFIFAFIYGVGGFLKIDLLAELIPKRYELTFYSIILVSVILKIIIYLSRKKRIESLKRQHF